MPGRTSDSSDENKWFSPVTLPQSCAGASPQKSLVGLPRVAKDIAADVYNNIQRWNDYHIKGAEITKSIAQLKAGSSRMYPDGLESLTNDLYEIVQKLSGVAKALEFLASQMDSLLRVHKEATPLFFTLSDEELAQLVQGISKAYQAELKVKEHVLGNIAHTNEKSEIMFYAVSWAHQQNITSEVNLQLEKLLTETGHRKIT